MRSHKTGRYVNDHTSQQMRYDQDFTVAANTLLNSPSSQAASGNAAPPRAPR